MKFENAREEIEYKFTLSDLLDELQNYMTSDELEEFYAYLGTAWYLDYVQNELEC